MTRYREILSGYDLSTFPKLREKDVKALEETLSIDIPTLVKQVKVSNGVPVTEQAGCSRCRVCLLLLIVCVHLNSAQIKLEMHITPENVLAN